MSDNNTQNTKKLVRFDWAMKNILRHKANFDILEGFLTSLLGEEITIENVLESESNKERADGKNNRVDLKCRDTFGREIIIEVQAQYEYDYLQRIFFGTSKAVVERVSVGGKYRTIPKIISVNILFHPLVPDKNDDYIYHGKTEITGMHTGGHMMVRLDAELLPEQGEGVFPEYYFLCVGNFKSERVKEKIDEWFYFFKTERIDASFSAPGIKAAEDKLSYLKMTEKEQREYNAYMDALHYETSTLATAISTGKAEGRAEGKAEGKAEGRAEGKVEGEQAKAAETARNMLSDGVAIENISKWTGLQEAEITALK